MIDYAIRRIFTAWEKSCDCYFRPADFSLTFVFSATFASCLDSIALEILSIVSWLPRAICSAVRAIPRNSPGRSLKYSLIEEICSFDGFQPSKSPVSAPRKAFASPFLNTS